MVPTQQLAIHGRRTVRSLQGSATSAAWRQQQPLLGSQKSSGLTRRSPHALQFRRKREGAGRRRARRGTFARESRLRRRRGGSGQSRLLTQAAGLGQRSAPRLPLQTQRQLRMLQEREESKTLLTVHDHPITVRQQTAGRGSPATVQLLVPLLQQVKLQQTVCQAHEHRLAHD